MNKKILFLFSSAAILLLGVLILTGLPSGFVLAQLHGYGTQIAFQDIVPAIEKALWIVFEAIAVVCFVIAGILFLTAQGEPEKLKTARAAFIWGVVGVVVGIVAYSITEIITAFFTAKK